MRIARYVLTILTLVTTLTLTAGSRDMQRERPIRDLPVVKRPIRDLPVVKRVVRVIKLFVQPLGDLVSPPHP